MESFLQNRKKCTSYSEQDTPSSTEEGFAEITTNRTQLPKVEVEVPVSHTELTPPKVAYQIEDNVVRKIIVTCPDGQILTIHCDY